MDEAPVVQSGTSLSVGSGRLTREFTNFTFTINSARARLPGPSSIPDPFSLISAVARFVWMMAGSDRLESIRHYSKGVERFTDDGFVVPGSSYGSRLFYARPGLDQIKNVVATLKNDPTSRRAMATVFQPEDTGRKSRDIPCTYGLSFMIRNGELHATTIMRSNNAWTLLPYNIFEFSLLAEVVAGRVGVPLGSYTHSCISLHLYETDFDAAYDWLAKDDSQSNPMRPIGDLDTFDRIAALLSFEEKLRAEYTLIDGNTIRSRLREVETFQTTLRDFALILLIHSTRKNSRISLADSLLGRLSKELLPYVPPIGTVQPELPFA